MRLENRGMTLDLLKARVLGDVMWSLDGLLGKRCTHCVPVALASLLTIEPVHHLASWPSSSATPLRLFAASVEAAGSAADLHNVHG